MTHSIVDEPQKHNVVQRKATPKRTYWRIPFISSTKRDRANLRCLKSARWTWAAVSARSTGGAFQGLGSFCVLIWILVTQMVQFLNILLGCTLTISAVVCNYVTFQHNVNQRKQTVFPNLTSQSLCCLALSHWYQMAWTSEDGFQRIAGVTSPKARREMIISSSILIIGKL